ncbi:CDP-alcohol phosphatidyltransferase family protein [Salaquimonas pukyongi]|uniref:CDP-alcohol phosphatidyltransferase family protein n=1 Tax=Salaquimonas pukyongi TaxID=2712698 RepID=UPI00096B9509|nr:CDP-alcohol phosphatidyltransferase family protein [Salaquimonas pukyongi]
MLDGIARKQIDPLLMAIASRLAKTGITPNQITVAGFFVGVAAAAAIAAGWFLTGLALLLASRLADGLDGSLARLTKTSDFGGFLDIVLDFAFYGIIPLGFIFTDPEQNALAGATLIFSFYVNGASFLAFATLAEKRKLTGNARGTKSIFFTTGLAEATETLAVFVLACLFPAWFSTLAWVFAAVCFYTALVRILQARETFYGR